MSGLETRVERLESLQATRQRNAALTGLANQYGVSLDEVHAVADSVAAATRRLAGRSFVDDDAYVRALAVELGEDPDEYTAEYLRLVEGGAA